MRGLTGWLVLVVEDDLKRVIQEGAIGSDIVPLPPTLKKGDEVFLASSLGDRVRVVGLFAIKSVEERINLKPEILLAEKMLELNASEMKAFEGKEGLPAKGTFSLVSEDYDKLREGLERLGMEESMGAGLTIPG